jgi:hypothetical protein
VDPYALRLNSYVNKIVGFSQVENTRKNIEEYGKQIMGYLKISSEIKDFNCRFDRSCDNGLF